ncbi:MAG: HAMP domain-containing sensor histidine kinase [Lachnospiraceae bacterium]|nr:HAMP domain-containing sensor histidine kinase [Lachnospiraceae bacterium]
MNRRKKIKFWHGIRFRMTAGLLFLAMLSGILLYAAATEMTRKNMEQQVVSDLQLLLENTKVYARQTLMLNNQNNDEEGFLNCASEIIEELRQTSRHRIALFSLDGTGLLSLGYEDSYEKDAVFDEISSKDSFANALSGQASYSLFITRDGRYEVWFAMPLFVEGKQIGIVSYQIDYSDSYQQYSRIVRMVLNITLVILLLITCAILLFLTGILRPVQRLSRISSRVAAQIREEKISTDHLIGPSLTRRKDEIGQLARDYNLMLQTVESQFTRISEDRDNILQLLNSRQEFYNNVTHELKTPLTTIKGYAQLLEADHMQDEELFRTGLSHIQHESTRLHQMVLQLLEMSHREIHTRMVPVDAAAVLTQVAASMSLKARRYHNEIRVEGLSELVILGNEERLRELFINLIDNAIKYGDLGKPIVAQIETEASFAVIRIINEGPGIAPESLPHIFEPFFREDKERSRELGSAGLGLSLCKKIAEEHSGTITAKSIPGKETVFLLHFPLYKEESDS